MALPILLLAIEVLLRSLRVTRDTTTQPYLYIIPRRFDQSKDLRPKARNSRPATHAFLPSLCKNYEFSLSLLVLFEMDHVMVYFNSKSLSLIKHLTLGKYLSFLSL